MDSLFKPDMTPEQFIDTAFQHSCEEVLERVSKGQIPAEVESFVALHDHMDANCLAGLCDDDMYPTFLTIFPKKGEDEEVLGSEAFMHAVNTIQGRVDAWIKAGGMLEAQVIQRGHGDDCTEYDTYALLVDEELKRQLGEGLNFEQWACVLDLERAEEARDMLDDIRDRVLTPPVIAPYAATNA